MIKTPSSTVIGGAGIWTPSATILGSASNLTQLIKSIFANNEQGFAYDLNDFSTMFQDAAGTVPVTGVGQPVGLIKDKSGRNNHAYQTTAASRPVLQRNATTGAYYLAFDGVDDFLQTNAIDFTATDKISLFTAVNITTFKFTPVCELSSDPNLNTGTFALSFDNGASTAIMRSRGTGALRDAAAVMAVGLTTVLSGQASINTDRSLLRKNAIQVALTTTDQGTGNYGNYPLFIARRGGVNPQAFVGNIYSLICISRLTTDAETLALEKAIAKLIGVTLNV